MFEKILVEFGLLFGFAAIVTITVNILKIVKIKGVPIVKDGTADKWAAGFNLVGIMALYVTRLFIPSFDPLPIDNALNEIAVVANFAMQYITMILGSKVSHIALIGLPVIGKSYTLDRMK